MAAPRWVAGQFRQFGWDVEVRRHVIATLLGHVEPLPAAALWGHLRCTAMSPLWAYPDPKRPFAACRRVWERRPADAVGLFGLEATRELWEALSSFSSQMPVGAEVWVASRDDLRRGIARLVRHGGAVTAAWRPDQASRRIVPDASRAVMLATDSSEMSAPAAAARP